MKNFIILIAFYLAFSSAVFAQKTVEEVVKEIENNNTTLIALRQNNEAQKLENKTGIYLQNPEVEFNYLWGSPTQMGNRQDFSVKQSFDFPTAYSYKNQISDLKNEQADLSYQKQLMAIKLQTRFVCYDLIYTNALKQDVDARLEHAQRIFDSYKAKFELGETSILDFNKAKLNLANAQSDFDKVSTERQALLMQLRALNGGLDIDFTNSSYPVSVISTDFEQWYTVAETNNPTLSWLKKEIEIGEKQVGLNRANSLPKMEAGYMSETTVGQEFKGVSVGLSIPLWENKNKVKYAKANAMAMEHMATDNKLQFYNQLKALHAKTIGLQNNFASYQSSMLALNQSDLLKQAFQNGELSLIDYMVELAFQYDSTIKLLDLERELNKSTAELKQYEK